MKDYYKILGVKQDAFSEEIHARWIQLMRKLHPDMGKVEETELEKVREINEAYGVLKDPSLRGQYDLRRAYQRKKRTIHLKRVLIPPAILIILLILGIIIMIMQRTRAVSRLESSTVPKWSSTETVVNPPPSLNIKEKRAIRHTNEINGKNRITSPQKTSAPVEKAKALDEVEKPALPPRLPKPGNVTGRSGHASTMKNATNDTNRTNETNQISGINQVAQLNPIRVPKDRKPSPVFAKAPKSVKINRPARAFNDKPANSNTLIGTHEANQTNQINEKNQIDETKLLVTQLDQPSLVATEAEIREFFAKYKQQYALMDIDGFLSLFSQSAVQNEVYGLEEIKEIYSEFFNKSLKLQYDIEDVRIQIYQNAAEILGRYKIVQTVSKAGKTKIWRGYVRWILIREDGALKIRFLDFRAEKSD
jgi:curved DNA-binding protein CbpA